MSVSPSVITNIAKLILQMYQTSRYMYILVKLMLILFVVNLINFAPVFNSDMRFLRRPQYGEYKYLPKSLWLSVVLVSVPDFI